MSFKSQVKGASSMVLDLTPQDKVNATAYAMWVHIHTHAHARQVLNTSNMVPTAIYFKDQFTCLFPYVDREVLKVKDSILLFSPTWEFTVLNS